MSLKIAGCQFLIAALILVLTVSNREAALWWHVLAFYSAWSFFVVGCGYALIGPRIFCKRSDGRLDLVSLILIAPFHMFSRVVWYISRFLSSDAVFAAVDDRLWFGRRLTARDLKRPDFPSLVGCLDLTAEFTETASLRQLPKYQCVPILDGTAPSVSQLHQLADWLHEAKESGSIYVHCAQGYGRTGAVLVAYLILYKQAKSVDDALMKLRQLRSQVRLNRDQRRILDQFALDVRCDGTNGCADSSSQPTESNVSH